NQPRGKSPVLTANKVANAKKKGAAAVLIISETLPSQKKLNNSYRPKPDVAAAEELTAIPAFIINDNVIKTAGHTISEIKASVGNNVIEPITRQVPASLQYGSGKITATVSNVIGLVEGSDKKDEYLFVTAHYDHVGIDEKGNIYYGADDDGSGTVSVMKMAE